MTEHHIKFKVEKRYYLLGTPNPEIKHVWFVCHGYGQLARYFIKKFEVLHNEQSLIVAPEGLSRFYLQGFSGRVGATWMTKEDRESDISNYVTYLNAIAEQIVKKCSKEVKITVLGFSQGAATASRWIAQSDLSFHRFILWSGIFPEDLDIVSAQEKLRDIPTYVIFGKNDPLITKEAFEQQSTTTKKLKIAPEVIRFEGGHEIDERILKTFANH